MELGQLFSRFVLTHPEFSAVVSLMPPAFWSVVFRNPR